MREETVELKEEVVLMEDKRINVKFTSTDEVEFRNALGQIIKSHSTEI